jgi:NADPH:quinone reductase-like Zn-dependent oxidoreductase
MIARRYGGSDVFELAELPRPEPAPGEVLVRMVATGANPVDWEVRAGYAADWYDDGPYIWGWDVSGVVEAVGAGVSALAPGDEVFGMPRFPQQARAYAEYVTAPLTDLAPRPRSVGHLTSAALPLSGLTALQGLDLAEVTAGQTVLVNGAAGGVGHLAVQLVKARGASTVAVARQTHHDLLRELGADTLVDYTATPVSEAVTDAVDCVGDDTLPAVVRPGGVVIRVPGAAGGPGDLETAAERAGVRVLRHVVHPDGHRLRQLARLVDDGQLTAAVTHTFPLEEAARAHDLMEAGHARGKTVLTVSPPA